MGDKALVLWVSFLLFPREHLEMRSFRFCSQALTRHRGAATALPHRSFGVKVTVKNWDQKGATKEIEGKLGESLLEACWAAHVVPLEGACDHAMACSTCQVYVVEKGDKLAPPSEEELDMLDLAFSPQDNSRLACQITLTQSIDGLVVQVPSGISNRLQDF